MVRTISEGISSMSTQALVLSAKKPVSDWNKAHKWSTKALFKLLAKTLTRMAGGAIAGAGAGAATGSMTSAVLGSAAGALASGASEITSDLFDAVTANEPVELEPPELAWVLIQRALSQAMQHLVLETSLALARMPSKPEELSASLEELLDRLDRREVEVNASLFRQPGDLPLLSEIRAPFRQLLLDQGIGEGPAKLAEEGLRLAFVFALREEWSRRSAIYSRISDWLQTPFCEASEQERAWESYAIRLREKIKGPIFNDELKLADVYVWPRACWLEEVAEEVSKGVSYDGRKRCRVVVHLARELDAWIDRGDPGDAVRVIAGGPGAGKSSFAAMYAESRSARGDRVLLIPLYGIREPTRDLDEIVGEFARENKMPQNPIDARRGEKRLLLIFDGLDELSMRGQVAADVAKEFVRHIITKVQLRNHDKLRLQVILDGREVVVQACEGELRNKPSQVLYLLPYYVSAEERKQWAERGGWKDPEDLLDKDQRDDWWKSYQAAMGRAEEAFPNELKKKEFEEITGQPLLCYLIAFIQKNGNINLAETETNRNTIYERLVKAVYERHYAGKRPHPEVKNLSYEEFSRALEEVSLATWHGNGRSATIREIEVRCEASGVLSLLDKIRAGAVKGATRLLAAFYYRKRDEAEGDDTFELTHKSFGEYLVARRLMRELTKIDRRLRESRETYDGDWNERTALSHWASLCGPSAMDPNLHKFLCDEAALCGQDAAGRGQEMLCSLISAAVQRGMPMERVEPRLRTFHDEVRHARNAEEALLAAHCAFALVTRKVGNVKWPDAGSAGGWITRLRGQRVEDAHPLVAQCLQYLFLAKCSLQWIDLGGADLEGADLKDANLKGANLEAASLDCANLERAVLERANLEGASLRRAMLKEANLKSANLQRAIFKGANLLNAVFDGANQAGASFDSAYRGGVSTPRAIDMHRPLPPRPSTPPTPSVAAPRPADPVLPLKPILPSPQASAQSQAPPLLETSPPSLPTKAPSPPKLPPKPIPKTASLPASASNAAPSAPSHSPPNTKPQSKSSGQSSISVSSAPSSQRSRNASKPSTESSAPNSSRATTQKATHSPSSPSSTKKSL
jgi:hypothetical protein